MSIWTKLDRYPPVLVRLLARHPDGRAMTDQEIYRKTYEKGSQLGMLTAADVRYLSFATSWSDVPVGKMRSFVIACGVDFANRRQMQKHQDYLKDPKFSHLKRDKNFPQFKEMLKTYLESQLHAPN